MSPDYDPNWRHGMTQQKYDFPMLYKKDSKGRIRIYKIQVIGDEQQATIMTTTGFLDDPEKWKNNAKEVAHVKNCNDVYDRCVDNCETTWKGKVRKGYVDNANKAANESVPKIAMLVKDVPMDQLDTVLTRADFPLYVQPKLNGIRATYHRVDNKLYSRNMKVFDKMGHLLPELEQICATLNVHYLDMELYCHGYMINEIVSMVRNGNHDIKAWLFDIPYENETKQKVRIQLLNSLATQYFEFVRFVPAMIARQVSDIKAKLDEIIRAGGEGVICRNMEAPYKWDNKNSRDLRCFKVKPTLSEEFDVVGMGMEKRIHEGKHYTLVNFVCRIAKGETFTVSPTSWGLEKRDQIWKDFVKLGSVAQQQHIAKLAPLTIEFREWTKSGKPFHILEVISRDYE